LFEDPGRRGDYLMLKADEPLSTLKALDMTGRLSDTECWRAAEHFEIRT